MLRRIACILILVLTASVIGFAVYYTHPSPERVVSRLLDELQSGDIRGAERLTTGGLGLDSSNSRSKKLYRAMYKSMRYVVVDSAVGDTSAQVSVTVTMVDMEVQIAAASYQLLSSSLSGGARDSKRLYQLLTEQLEEEGGSTVTYSAIVSLVRDGKGRWRVDSTANGDFLVAITGGVGPF